MMRLWPFKRPERRNYSNAILNALTTGAATKASAIGATAAVEAVSGLLARSLSVADISSAPAWAQAAISPAWLAMVGRELIRNGEHLSAMSMNDAGELMLLPSADWTWRGGAIEADWTATINLYGPSGSTSREVGRHEVVYLQWAGLSIERHRGRGPLSLASLAAQAAAETERSIADEVAGPLAQMLTVPEGIDVGSDDNSDVSAQLRKDLHSARGRAVILESVASNWGQGGGMAPGRDWVASRLGPHPPESVVALASDSFGRLCAACGASPALFNDADGTAKREALRQFFLTCVRPVARQIERELSDRLEAEVRFGFDSYPTDIAGRAGAFARLVQGGMAVERAAAVSGVLNNDEN